ncbi:myo-inositol catabolism protein (plasmid) [Azospirillum sp. B510]|uniref:5-deoxy-glucuronate isomerase n=1 Tax=Azospirillum sp. (strain B510) TaxID=137722 RepID=UPI0001C4CA97|nr:5-deoxy-glucuronate isomerase [Azospirillum sp. B510]BAI74758.1 myo-inositol catabolism protein [Azospirillum sp. B510]
MSKLLLRNHSPDTTGRVHHVTPDSAGWTHVGFDLYRLRPGQTARGGTGGREVCLVLVAGRGSATAGRESWPEIGDRMSPFEDKRPYSIYVPQGEDWSVTATTPLELAVCSAPGGDGGHPVRLIRPEDVRASVRGKGANTRHVFDILPDQEPADSLLVVEVITPPGHWSSYPPHKHDVDSGSSETQLEETYYHRLDPPQGFAFQRVYTDDRSLDEAMAVEDGDLVMVPRGYHPVGAAHGYTGYYLNVMAGPRRAWHFNTAPEHRWLLG